MIVSATRAYRCITSILSLHFDPQADIARTAHCLLDDQCATYSDVARQRYHVHRARCKVKQTLANRALSDSSRLASACLSYSLSVQGHCLLNDQCATYYDIARQRYHAGDENSPTARCLRDVRLIINAHRHVNAAR